MKSEDIVEEKREFVSPKKFSQKNTYKKKESDEVQEKISIRKRKEKIIIWISLAIIIAMIFAYIFWG